MPAVSALRALWAGGRRLGGRSKVEVHEVSQLSILQELAALERSRIDVPSYESQRQFRRHVIRGEAELYPVEHKSMHPESIDVQLRDASRGGVGFLSRMPLESDTTWRIEFIRHGFVVGEQHLVVRHCSQVREGLYLCGAQFIASAGLLTILGVSACDLMAESSGSDTEDNPFLAPTEVA